MLFGSPNWRDATLDAARLSDAEYFAERLRVYAGLGVSGSWYVKTHTHTCRHCQRVIQHTGLEATRDGDAGHMCCGHDVRFQL